MRRNLAKDLARTRDGIDRVDNGIMRLLAERRKLVLHLIETKKDICFPVFDRKREQALVDRVAKWGRRRGLNEAFVKALFRIIVTNSKETQRHETL